MFGVMGTSAAFAKAAGAKKQVNMLSFHVSTADPDIYELSCDGKITVKSIKGGEEIIESYSNLEKTTVSIQADANTDIIIKGDVTYLTCKNPGPGTGINPDSIMIKSTALTSLNCRSCSALTTLDLSANTALTSLNCRSCTALTTLDLSANTALTSLDCSNCAALTTLDLSDNTALTDLNCTDCAALTTLDLSDNTALTSLNCGSCTALTTLDLSDNTALTSLDCGSCTALTTLDLSANTALIDLALAGCEALTVIKCLATNENVSIAVANAITTATAADGTVYTDSEGAYYSTIADAATDKGWTIEQL